MVINYKIFSKRWVPTMLLIFIVSACSLDIEGTDSIILPEEEGIFNGVTDVSSSLDGLFQDLRGQHESQDNFYALVTVATDELLVPTRGTDWGDNGIWRTLHAHTWSPSHKYLLTVWNQFNQNIFRATEVIDPRSGGTPAQVAEAKFVRAYSMWQIMELYGIVPFRGPDDGPDVNPIVKTRTEAYGDILQDLTQALADLPASGGVGNIRPTKAAAHYLLAKLKLNAHIYDGTGSPSAGTMTEVVGHVDAIEAEGFGLGAVGEYFDLFVEGTDTETIWYTESSVGNRMWNGLHYHQVTPTQTGGGWNGFTTLAEFYDTFEGDANTNQEGDGEERRGFTPNEFNSDATNWGIGSGFLLGRQWRFDNDNGAVALNDRAGGPLVFTKQLPGLVGNGEASGIRVMKYSPGNGDFAGHLVMFRYADAHLMRAEAILNGGTAGSNGTALAEVNDLRASRGGVNGAALTILTSLTADILLEERGRELYTEMWRRNDMIRFGKFTRGWEFKDAGSVGDVKWNLYPIPSDALLSNPNLQQNDGY